MSVTRKTVMGPRKRLSDATWPGVGHQVDRRTAGSWTVTCDLAEDLRYMVPSLDEESAGALVQGAASGLPVVLTWRSGGYVKTATVIVEWVTAWPDEVGGAEHARVQVRYWAFAHGVFLSDVVSARVPEFGMVSG